ncbi:MAG: hypothetical protein JF612_00755, partial [Planctomycetia bacterium]|nr:hypothetical protein [Planctomycetia bacterium]
MFRLGHLSLRRATLSTAILLICTCSAITSAADFATALRRPVGLAPSTDGHWLYVANRDAGSLSIINLNSSQVVAEHKIGRQITDIAAVCGSQQLLAIDGAAHELLLINIDGEQAQVVQRLS